MLTNKAIAEKNGFQNLYRVFDDRYTADVNEHIETFLTEIQALTLASLKHRQRSVCNKCIHYIVKTHFVLQCTNNITSCLYRFDQRIIILVLICLKQESFAHAVSSNEFKFSEVLKYGKYLNEETEYITMHKTKGTSIDSVVVVMEEFYWSQYKFSSIYSSQCDPKAERASNSRDVPQ